MTLIQEAYERLFQQECNYQTELEYNRRLSNFNANIKFNQKTISVNLNLQWKDIDKEIKIGLIQSLLVRVFKREKSIKLHTQNIDYYNNFIRNIPLFIEKNKSDPILEASFKRVNEMFFDNILELPNLTWGTDSRRKLASYNFHDDTVSVSTLFKNTRIEILDYLMYHELLHKQIQFKHKNGRSAFHTKEFREAEKLYPNFTEIDQEINTMLKYKKTTPVKRKMSLFRFF